MTTPNPMETTFPTPAPPISKKTYTIGGILTTVFGLTELPQEADNVACLWLLHPRLQTQKCMEPIAASIINDWNNNSQKRNSKDQSSGLIAVSFDQRNHGSRQINPLANEAWRSGNDNHAQDMFSIYHGTSLDTSQLITYLPSYIFPHSEHTITTNLVLGISLGGHAAWHCILHDPRITTAIVVIGCPDYVNLMSDRARLSKLKTWTQSSPPGSSFIGSRDFPSSLVQAIEAYDPAGLFLGDVARTSNATYGNEPTEDEKKRLIPLMEKTLKGKRVLNLSGGADKLVPYKRGEAFLQWLKNATGPDGWWEHGEFVLEDIVFDGVGHAMSPDMMTTASRFVVQTLFGPDDHSLGRPYKI